MLLLIVIRIIVLVLIQSFVTFDQNGPKCKFSRFRKFISPDSGVSIIFYIFSRFIRVETMKTKYAKDTLQAFKKKILSKKILG